jgi:hypothetical protein
MPSEVFPGHNLGECFPTRLETSMLKCRAETDDLSEYFHYAIRLQLGVYEARQAFSIDSGKPKKSKRNRSVKFT